MANDTISNEISHNQGMSVTVVVVICTLLIVCVIVAIYRIKKSYYTE